MYEYIFVINQIRLNELAVLVWMGSYTEYSNCFIHTFISGHDPASRTAFKIRWEMVVEFLRIFINFRKFIFCTTDSHVIRVLLAVKTILCSNFNEKLDN